MKKTIAAAVLVVFAVWFLYDQTGDFEFLRFDDHDYTFRCAFVRDGLSCANVAEAFSNATHAAVWMPATYISYMADISLFGPGMAPHHFVNVAIHSLNAVLLLLLLLALSRRCHSPPSMAPCLLAALFWALLLLWLRQGTLCRAAATLCCALACMSKPTAMCFPFLALAVESVASGRLPSRKSALLYLPCLALAAATGALAVYSQTHAEGYAVRELFSASLPWRILNAAVATGLSLFQLVVPVGIHLDYRAVPGRFPIDGAVGLSALALAAVLFAAAALKRHRDAARSTRLFALALFFSAALVPTLGIFGSFGEHARADRFLYLPMMAVSIALSLWRTRRPKTAAAAGSVVVLAALALSYPVVASYRNDHAAFSRALKFDPDHGEARLCAPGTTPPPSSPTPS